MSPGFAPDESGDRPGDVLLLQHLLDAVGDGIYGLDADGRTTFVNRAAAALLGYTTAELQGRRHHELIHHSRADGTPLPWEQCPIGQAIRNGTPVRSDDDVFWRRDGTSFPVAYSATPILDDGARVGVVVSFRDLTEKRRAEKEAERALYELVTEQAARAEAETTRAQLHRTFLQVPAAVAILRGPEHVFEMANPAYLETVGKRSLVGRPIREALPELGDQPVIIQLLDGVYGTGEPYLSTETAVMLVRDGVLQETFFNFIYQPLLDAENKVYGIMVHAVEVTELVRARRLVEEKAAELARLAAELERSNRELDQFAYVTSHDLKAPLRGIANLAEWIEEDLDERLTPEAREHLRLLGVRVHRMEALIDGILQYSRAGRVRAKPERVDTAALVHDVIELIAPPPEYRIDVAPALPTVLAERLPLQQVFQNLIANAMKHGRGDPPVIRVSARHERDDVVFSIVDNGPGIAPEYHDRIWGIFQTLEARDKVEGTGIGLALVKKLLESRGGRIWVESEAGRGAAFHFALPAAPHGDRP